MGREATTSDMSHPVAQLGASEAQKGRRTISANSQRKRCPLEVDGVVDGAEQASEATRKLMPLPSDCLYKLLVAQVCCRRRRHHCRCAFPRPLPTWPVG